ncbi:fungal-specific transcription factor domain-containing protein [Schizophyllum commune]
MSQGVGNEGPSVLADEHSELKKRRADKACDFCRRRKSKRQSYSPAANNSYIQSLEKRNDELEQRNKVLQERVKELEETLDRHKLLSPSTVVDNPAPAFAKDSSTQAPIEFPQVDVTKEQLREMASVMLRIGTQGREHAFFKAQAAGEHPGDSELQDEDLYERMRLVKLSSSAFDKFLGNKFLGKSSTAHLVLKLINLKKPPNEPHKIPSFYSNGRRIPFWTAQPWECALLKKEPASHDFPEQDLMLSLIDLYFRHVQPFFPLLHRPTFEEGVRAAQYFTDHDFGVVVLLVCALGAQYSDDPRTLSEEYEMDTHSRGWKWFSQAEKVHKPIVGTPTLLEIQAYCLSALFMLPASNLMTEHIWARIGVALRYVQDVGAHRRPRQKVPTAEDELWHRATWTLVVLDRNISAILGRNCAMQDEDLDIRYPMDVDDEYWLDPDDAERSWKQPADKPSKVSCFIACIKLSRIVEITARLLYGGSKYGCPSLFYGEGWYRDVVQELDSALNKWHDELPEHLRWDPEQTNVELMNQAAFLDCSYRAVQILIHRPFLTAQAQVVNSPLPSLTICTTAAKTCAHVCDQQRRKTGAGLPYIMVRTVPWLCRRRTDLLAQYTASVSAIILLVSMWSRAKPRSSREQLKELNDVRLLMEYIKSMEDRWVTAGRTADVLNELRSIGDMPTSQLGKRTHDGPPEGQRGNPQPSPASWQAGPSLPSVAIQAHLGVESHLPTSSPQNGVSPGGYPPVDIAGVDSWSTPMSSSSGQTSSSNMDGRHSAWSFDDMGMVPELAGNAGAGTTNLAPDILDQESMAIWSSVPQAFDPNDWLSYLSNLAVVPGDHNNAQSVQNIDQASSLPYVFPEGSDMYSYDGGYPL